MEECEFPKYVLSRTKNIPWIHLPGDPNREQRRQMERNEKRKKRGRYGVKGKRGKKYAETHHHDKYR